MKIGDTFYFVDESLCKIIKHKLLDQTESKFKSGEGCVNFSGGKFILLMHFNYNSTPENYCISFIRFWGSNKNYLVFTEVKDAQNALINYILPKKLDIQKKAADKLCKQFQQLLDKTEKTENEIQSNIKNFDKKCNALKNKFV